MTIYRKDGNGLAGAGDAIAPGEELPAIAHVGLARVQIPDGDGEELQGAFGGGLAGVSDQTRNELIGCGDDRAIRRQEL